MDWIDIASIVFVCVTMNHLGLITAIESVIKNRLPILNCPKCCTFWSVLLYGLTANHFEEILELLAISFLASYIAIWLELFEGFIDTLFLKLYGKIYNTSDNAPATNPDEDNSASTMPKLYQNYKKRGQTQGKIAFHSFFREVAENK